jgi:threonine dehydrogenase-like Zn-dependent dehydrogenase
MKATLMYGAGDVRIEDVPDPAIRAPADAIVRVVRAIEDTGAEVTGLKRGGLVLSPFTYADNTCLWCRRGLGAGQIVLMGRHTDRTDLGAGFGATDIVLASGEEGVAEVRKLTGGHGADAVLECVGSMQTLTTSFGAVRDGGVISRVGVPSYTEGPIGMDMIMRNITLTGGVDPARHYIDGILPDVLEGRIDPGQVFDRTVGLDGVVDGYRAMAGRQSLKVLIAP